MAKILNRPWAASLPAFLLYGALALYLLILLPVIATHGLAFDEHTDWLIASSYTFSEAGWLRGSNVDAINVRLPMFVTGILYEIADLDHIRWSRYLSCLLGLSTILAVYLYGHREFSPLKGGVAALLVAVSPYFLAFSKVAMTEGDIYITAFTAWLLYFTARLRRDPNMGWLVLTGLSLGLACSAKISAMALLPAVGLALAWPGRGVPARPAGQPGQINPAWFAVLLAAGLIAVVTGWWLTQAAILSALAYYYHDLSLVERLVHYGLVLACWLAFVVLGYRHRNMTVALGWQLVLVAGFALLTFFAIPPVHTTNPWVIQALVAAFTDARDAFHVGFAAEALLFHFMVILIKPGPLLGTGLWLALVVALFRWPSGALRLPVLFVLSYLGFLVLKMTWAQTYYMMPLYPLLALLLADLAVDAWQRYRVPAMAVSLVGLGLSGYELARVYPDMHLNGYQWVGERYLGGRSTIGYRSIAQTPSDGVEQALRWSRENVPDAERLIYYLHDNDMVSTILKGRHILAYSGYNGINGLADSNYVLTSINAEINHGWGRENPNGEVRVYPYDRDELLRDFRKVFSVERAFGIEMAAVWYRRVPYKVNPASQITGHLTEEAGLTRHPPPS